MTKNFKLFCCIIGVLVFMNIWTQVNSRFHFNPLPHAVPVDQVPNASGRTSDMTSDGRYIWVDDAARLDGDTSNFTIPWHHQASSGVSQEEVNFEQRLIVQKDDMILNGVMTVGESNAVAGEVRDFLDARIAKESSLAPLHNGGFWDRVSYRRQMDELNSQPTPYDTFSNRRVADESSVQYLILIPVFAGGAAFLVFGYVGKHAGTIRKKVVAKRVTSKWDGLLANYNRARVINTSRRDLGFRVGPPKEGMAIDGPFAIRYPKLFVNDTPFDLEKAIYDEEHPGVIFMHDGTQLALYHREVAESGSEQYVPRKPKPKWMYENTQPRPPAAEPVKPCTYSDSGSRRPSIFNQS